MNKGSYTNAVALLKEQLTCTLESIAESDVITHGGSHQLNALETAIRNANNAKQLRSLEGTEQWQFILSFQGAKVGPDEIAGFMLRVCPIDEGARKKKGGEFIGICHAQKPHLVEMIAAEIRRIGWEIIAYNLPLPNETHETILIWVRGRLPIPAAGINFT